MDELRVADYFVVAGLGEGVEPQEDGSNEVASKSSLEPITDIAIINRSAGEKVPKNFVCLESTPSNFPANLNHGAIRCPDLFICYRRGQDKPPLKDIGILYDGKERVMEGCEVVHTTPGGRSANINNSNSSHIFITYRRAADSAASDTLVVVDLCVILTNKGEEPPVTYNQILKNLNKGMVGSDVYLCYKKAMVKTDALVYKPTILGRYPEEDYDNFALPDSVPLFCLPQGATIESWSAKANPPSPCFSTFILTPAGGEKVYGAAVSFFEEYPESKLSDTQLRTLGLKNRSIREQYKIQKTVHARKAVCLLSHWPFFEAFKKFLSHLYKVSTTGPHAVPIERHISHFMYDVPYPSPQRPRILVQLTHDSLSLCMPEDSPLPQSGASFITLLRNLGPELCMNLLMYTLLENKILLHSLRPTVLTEVAEAVTSMIFPFRWQCPYIPLCPLGLSDVLNAPLPFIVGIDSRYFDLYDLPPDIICVDLDTNRLCLPDDKKQQGFKSMPKKAVKILQDSLHRLFEMSSSVAPGRSSEVSLEMTNVDLDFRRKKKQMQMELLIQEAFLRFMVILLRGYKAYLNPIMKQPNSRATDASVLFDMPAFLKSRDKANTKFYTQMMKTQMFFRFIEERSFVSENDANLAFFDECTENIDESRDDAHLIEMDSSQASERTVFILPPEPTGLPEGATFSYSGFPELRPELFLKKKESTLSLPRQQALCPNSPLARRTKQEVKAAQKLAQQHLGSPKQWAKCLVSHCYCLWFISYPAYVHTHPNKLDALKVGLAVMKKMHEAKLVFIDQVCYRVLMQLAGQHNKPGVAVQVFTSMKRHGVQPNAITYGYYNKVMLESKWKSPMSKGKRRWTKIRNLILGVAQFRQALRRNSVSRHSNSGSECDRVSRASVDSYADDHSKGSSMSSVAGVGSGRAMFSAEKGGDGEGKEAHSREDGGAADGGYNSMTKEDRQLSKNKRVGKGREVTAHPDGGGSHPLSSPHKSLPAPGDSKHSQDPQALRTDSEDQLDEHPGSIVCGSLTSFTDQDTLHILQGTLLNTTAGVLMVSQSFLEHGAYLSSGDLRLEVERAGSHHHHRRSSESSSSKRPGHARSKSMFTSWHPRHSKIDETTIIPPVHLSSLAGKGDDTSTSSVQSMEEAQQTSLSGVAAADSDSVRIKSVKDSGVGLDEQPNSEESGTSREGQEVENGGGLDATAALDTSALSDVKGECTAEKTDRCTDSCESGSDLPVVGGEVVCDFSQPSDGAAVSPPLHPDGSAAVKCVPHSVPSKSGSPVTLPTDGVDSRVKTGSNTGCEIDTRRGTAADTADLTLLGEMGRARSSSCTDTSSHTQTLQGLEPEESPTHSTKHLPSSEQHPYTESTKSLPPRDHPLRRSHSLKLRGADMMQKTNNTISGLWKLASKAASASYSKISEITHNIATPIKNAASISSLTRSRDSLDGGVASKGGKAEDKEEGENMASSGGGIMLGGEDSNSNGQCVSQIASEESGLGDCPSLVDEFPSGTLAMSSTEDSSLTVAMQVEMSSCSRCSRCHHLVFDEETMSGWSADDSNLNTKCPFCHAKFVPNLQVSVKDWRGLDHPPRGSTLQDLTLASDSALSSGLPSSPLHSCSSPVSPVDSVPSPAFLRSFDSAMRFDVVHSPIAESPERTPSSAGSGGQAFGFGEDMLQCMKGSEVVSTVHVDGMPLSLQQAALAVRRRFGNDPSKDSIPRCPLGIAIGEDGVELPSLTSAGAEVQNDIITRNTAEPQVFPYLSPLVLRKELEYVLDHEGDLCLAKHTFLDLHPIIFWNLVWYFRRLEIPSHLSGFLLSAAGCSSPQKLEDNLSSRNVSIRPKWDNMRIHDELGLPMYMAWDAGHKSTVVDALVTESEAFSRPCMHQIISSIQRNDMLVAIKQITQGRRRQMGRKRRFRSLYREILFLSFVACGRDNIDHDAFDREFALAFEEKLSPAEIRRLQPDDKPRSAYVHWCRKVFCELELLADSA